MVASTLMEEKQILIANDPPYQFGNEKSLSLWCLYYDHDGTDWIVAELEFKLDRYNGTKAIDALPYYPLEYHKQKDESASLQGLKLEFTK